MKKNILILLSLITFTAMAQTKGKFEVLDLKDFKLHVYYTNDALNDASYIVEGKNGLITLEQPLFKDNVAEFDARWDTTLISLTFLWVERARRNKPCNQQSRAHQR